MCLIKVVELVQANSLQSPNLDEQIKYTDKKTAVFKKARLPEYAEFESIQRLLQFEEVYVEF